MARSSLKKNEQHRATVGANAYHVEDTGCLCAAIGDASAGSLKDTK